MNNNILELTNQQIIETASKNIGDFSRLDVDTIENYINRLNGKKKEIEEILQVSDLRPQALTDDYNNMTSGTYANTHRKNGVGYFTFYYKDEREGGVEKHSTDMNLRMYNRIKRVNKRKALMKKTLIETQIILEEFREWFTGVPMNIGFTTKGDIPGIKKFTVMKRSDLLKLSLEKNIFLDFSKSSGGLTIHFSSEIEKLSKESNFIDFYAEKQVVYQTIVQNRAIKTDKSEYEIKQMSLRNNEILSTNLYNFIMQEINDSKKSIPEWLALEIFYKMRLEKMNDKSIYDYDDLRRYVLNEINNITIDNSANYKNGDAGTNTEIKNFSSGSSNALFRLSTIINQIEVIKRAYKSYKGDKTKLASQLTRLFFSTEDYEKIREKMEKKVIDEIKDVKNLFK